MSDSGLARLVVEFFISISSASTLPLFGFLSGGLLNLFIPSGGGQWAVQGPIMMAAAQEIGADLPRVAMAVALGDQWTNLIQPLALVPVLAIAGISVRHIMGLHIHRAALERPDLYVGVGSFLNKVCISSRPSAGSSAER